LESENDKERTGNKSNPINLGMGALFFGIKTAEAYFCTPFDRRSHSEGG